MLKKIFFIGFLLVLLGFAPVAQAQVMNKGDMGLNIGMGLGWNYRSGYSGYDYTPIPSINASLEFGTIETGEVGVISFGGFTSFRYSPYKYRNISSASYTEYNFLGRAAFHLNFFDIGSWDLYAGIETGFGVYTYRYKNSAGTYKSSDNYGVFGEFVGARYMFSDGFGAFAELGNGGSSYTKIGISFIF